MIVVLLFLTWLCNFVISADAVVPTYLPPDAGSSRFDLIKMYFQNGFTYKEILILLLSRHNITLSLSHLKQILTKLNLRRRQGVTYASIQVTAEAIINEMGDSGQCLGYRTMWRRLIKDHGLNVKRSTVMELLRELDPEGNASRKAHRLKRRRYILKGPNNVWHIDGYDKLKPYGFCIHGCIDGYSRRLIWLKVSSSNNNPRLIAKYYLDTLKQMKCTPRIVRADYGTENSVVSYLQPFFRNVARDSMSGLKSFIYGKSTSNQRIEAWWGILRRNGIHWWINLFKDLKDSNRFNLEDPVQQECLNFVLWMFSKQNLTGLHNTGTHTQLGPRNATENFPMESLISCILLQRYSMGLTMAPL